MPFTQSFPVGRELGALLSEAWNKSVVGVNPAQTIRYVSYNEALEFMRAKNSGDLLCLCRRNGQMAEALNHLERTHGQVFNKKTVYASIRDVGDAHLQTAAPESENVARSNLRLRCGERQPAPIPGGPHDRP